MINRVLGFAFDTVQEHVVLINKKRPADQAGCWNGIGGHCYVDEYILDAMQREFLEETGCEVSTECWKRAGTLQRDAFNLLHIFYTHVHSSRLRSYVRTATDEEVQIFSVNCLDGYKLVTGCRWLLELCRSFRLGEKAKGFLISETL